MFQSGYHELPIYVHIPFCTEKCAYCDFYSIPNSDSELQSFVVEQILAQLTSLLATLKPLSIPSVYIGGGTPNSIHPELFQRLVTGIARIIQAYSLPQDFEWTVELNPELITAEQLEFLTESPVNRLSVGTQSFSARSLRVIGRNAGLNETVSGVELLSSYWPQRWSLDLITGLPDQSRREAEHDLESALSYAPGHISLYTLTVEAGTPLEEQLKADVIRERASDEVAEILIQLWSILKDRGYRHYEISNLALPEEIGRHNWYYWRLNPYLGVGPAAVSTLQSSSGLPVRATTPASISRFTGSSSPETLLQTELLSPEQFLLEYIMMGLRTIPGIEVERFLDIFGYDIREILPHTLENHMKAGRLRLHTEDGSQYVSITEAGMLLLDTLLVQAAGEIEHLRPQLNWPPP
ncbi:MAG: radical SAM family heme chaperone HemW [Spirochaetota bacterium]